MSAPRLPGNVPADFPQRAAKTSNDELVAHYGVSLRTISRWRKIADVWSPRLRERPARPLGETVAPKKAVERRKPARRGGSSPDGFRLCRFTNQAPAVRINSHADAAARELQRLGEVIRCDEHKRYDPKGRFYRVWGQLRTPDEVVALAERKCGFDPNAWQRLGAAA